MRPSVRTPWPHAERSSAGQIVSPSHKSPPLTWNRHARLNPCSRETDTYRNVGRPRSGTHKVPTVDRILEAAEKAFGTHGYSNTRLEDIAKTAGIRRPSLLYHFSTKQSLYEAVVVRLFMSLLAALSAAIEQTDVDNARITALMDTLLQFLDDRPAFSPIVLREMIDGAGPGRTLMTDQVVPVLDQVEAWLRASVEDRAPADFDVRGAIVQVTINALVRDSSGPLRGPIWGEAPPQHTLLNRLFFLDPSGKD